MQNGTQQEPGNRIGLRAASADRRGRAGCCRGRGALVALAATATLAAASVAPAAAAGGGAGIEHGPASAALPALQVSAEQQHLPGAGPSETVTAPQDPAGDSPHTRQAAHGQLPATGITVAADTAAGWWDGTGTLTDAAPQVVEQGHCAALGDTSLALLGSGSLSKACKGTDGSLTGSPVGVGWVTGFDTDGPLMEVLLVGASTLSLQTYQALGELDVVFDGGAFAADFANCDHRAASGWSSCRTVAAGVALPPGDFVGVGTVGIEPPARARSQRDEPVTPATQRAALVALYNATDGANWTRNTNWNTTAPVADWYGITANTDGHVTHLGLYSNSLSGSIPTEIGNLTNLISLYLGNNSLSGSIPTEIGNLTNLRNLGLSNNSLSGSIPTEIGNLTNLISLWLSNNNLSGSIPTEIGNLTNLISLWLSNNNLSGSIPTEIGNLTNLRNLWLSNNNLSGAIPTEIGNLTNLIGLGLYSNSLSGAIPTEIGNLTNLSDLYLYSNSLSGAIPTEIGNLTNLIGLSLYSNSLSGAIPTEIGNLTNLRWLSLYSNSLSGSIPTEIGNLTNLRNLWLGNNDLSGCVPAALSSVPVISFDAGLPYCAPARLSVTAARAGESDGAVVFTVAVTPPVTGSDPPAAAPEISVSYTTTAGTAAAGVDYTTTSGTLTIAAGARYGTVSVPVVDDAVTERTETFTLSLSNPVGAELANSNARGWIHDTPQRRFPSTACADAAVRGDIAGVFAVEQTRYSDWHHVFVDVNLSCGGDLTHAVGYPTAVKVIAGPTDSITASRYCLVKTGTTQTTAAVSTAAGCRTSESPTPAKFTRDGRSTHIVQIPDTDIGSDHQLLAWIDLDTDGVFDAGEPYDIFDSGFSSREVGHSGLYDYRYPQDFVIEPLTGSTPVSRRGQDTELRLQLMAPTGEPVQRPGSEPIIPQAPVANAPVKAYVSIGPSHIADVMCLVTPTAATPSPNAGNTCMTDPDGVFIVRYRVPTSAVNLFRQQRDVVRVYLDYNRDGRHDHDPGESGHEPSDTIGVPIAKAVNYVALGDSYSSGEAGDTPPEGTTYQADVSDADAECRRWDQAYPHIFADEVLGRSQLLIDVTFATYACTGAKTHNIHDPSDPDPTPPPGAAHDTDRPSGRARLGAPVYRPTIGGDDGELLHDRDPRWEPRQAVSLAAEQEMHDVDMITVTIGGNDAGFADVLEACVSPLEVDGSCGADDLALTFQEVEDRVVATLDYLKTVAGQASIFVLGYPYFAPTLTDCADPTRIPGPSDRPPTFEYESPQCEMEHRIIRTCSSLSGSEVLGDSFLGLALVGSILSPNDGRINYREANFIQSSAMALNAAISGAASRSQVHFVDVVGGVAAPGAPEGFVGHSACAGPDAWLHGYVTKGYTVGLAASDGSFHPNEAGQEGYARILEQYVRDRVAAEDAQLSEAGLPVNPGTVEVSPTRARSSRIEGTASLAVKPGIPSTRQADASGEENSPGASGQSSEGTTQATAGYLVARRAASGAGCRSPFAASGEQVGLEAGGFAPGAAVSFSLRAASLDGTELSGLSVPAAVADSEGLLEVLWTVPSAPPADQDAAPRAYVVDASGSGAGGGTHTAYMAEPLVAYPQTAPCAVADAAATPLGRSVQIPLLANDVAPSGGSLDASSLWVQPVRGGDFAVDHATGSVTFTPDAGFSGAVAARYWVYDSWGIGVRGDVTVTVSAGCTISGTAGVVLIEGTAADDVICVPDPDDHRSFHVIDAKGGNDTIIGGAGVEWVYGGDGADTVYGRGGGDRIIAGSGADTVYGGSGMDHVYSADVVDTVIDDDYEMVVVPAVTIPQAGPEASDDWHHADVAQSVTIDVLGNDHDPNEDLDSSTLRITRPPVSGAARVITSAVDPAVQYVAGAGGFDSLVYEVCDALGACDAAEVTILVGTTGCTIVGTDAAETLRGTAGDDVICGLGGDDVIYGLGGDDIIIGGAGDDTLYGGDATLIGAADGDDLLWGGPGGDTLYGGNGTDTLWGGDGDDALYGNRRDDRIYAGAGDDTVVGGGENDLIFGGAGDDSLDGHAGDDTLWGGPGTDVLRGGNGDDTLWGGKGDDTITGGAGADNLHGGLGADDLDGNTQDDTLWGGAGDDTLDGQGHNDELHGGPGDDTLRGGAADDRIWGGAGDDTLDGGNGVDHLDGGDDTDACTRGHTSTGCENEGRGP